MDARQGFERAGQTIITAKSLKEGGIPEAEAEEGVEGSQKPEHLCRVVHCLGEAVCYPVLKARPASFEFGNETPSLRVEYHELGTCRKHRAELSVDSLLGEDGFEVLQKIAMNNGYPMLSRNNVSLKWVARKIRRVVDRG